MRKREDDVIPLDETTLDRLERLSKVTGTPLNVLAASLLRAILEDDAQAHATTLH